MAETKRGAVDSIPRQSNAPGTEKTSESAAVLKSAQEAVLSNRKKLRSGMGTGTYEVSSRPTGEKTFQVVVKAKVEVKAKVTTRD